MTKIAIISQPEQGVLIDIGGCTAVHEATQYLTSTLQVSSEFWDGQDIDLNLGNLQLTADELLQVLSIMAERGVKPRYIFATASTTQASLKTHNIKVASGSPATIQADGTIVNSNLSEAGSMPCDPITTESGFVPCAPTTAESGFVPCDPTTAESGFVPCDPTTAESGFVPCDPTTAGSGFVPCAPDNYDSAGNHNHSTNGMSTKDEPAAVEFNEQNNRTAAAQAAPTPTPAPAPHVLYLRQTLRSGQAVSHKGHLIIVGDVNPGAEVMADGDITIWGALRGVAHAGVGGNTAAEIRALKFDPIQLRIAQAIARSPDRPRISLKTSGPETARIVNGIIRISSSAPE